MYLSNATRSCHYKCIFCTTISTMQEKPQRASGVLKNVEIYDSALGYLTLVEFEQQNLSKLY